MVTTHEEPNREQIKNGLQVAMETGEWEHFGGHGHGDTLSSWYHPNSSTGLTESPSIDKRLKSGEFLPGQDRAPQKVEGHVSNEGEYDGTVVMTIGCNENDLYIREKRALIWESISGERKLGALVEYVRLKISLSNFRSLSGKKREAQLLELDRPYDTTPQITQVPDWSGVEKLLMKCPIVVDPKMEFSQFDMLVVPMGKPGTNFGYNIHAKYF